MADNVMFNVSNDFDINVFAERLADTYRAKGYNVSIASLNNSVVMSFEKDLGGLNSLLGMGEGIKATIIRANGGAVAINFSDEEWTSKIIGLAVGWVLCFIPFITAIVGCSRQSSLPRSIGNDAMMIASNM